MPIFEKYFPKIRERDLVINLKITSKFSAGRLNWPKNLLKNLVLCAAACNTTIKRNKRPPTYGTTAECSPTAEFNARQTARRPLHYMLSKEQERKAGGQQHLLHRDTPSPKSPTKNKCLPSSPLRPHSRPPPLPPQTLNPTKPQKTKNQISNKTKISEPLTSSPPSFLLKSTKSEKTKVGLAATR